MEKKNWRGREEKSNRLGGLEGLWVFQFAVVIIVVEICSVSSLLFSTSIVVLVLIFIFNEASLSVRFP